MICTWIANVLPYGLHKNWIVLIYLFKFRIERNRQILFRSKRVSGYEIKEYTFWQKRVSFIRFHFFSHNLRVEQKSSGSFTSIAFPLGETFSRRCFGGRERWIFDFSQRLRTAARQNTQEKLEQFLKTDFFDFIFILYVCRTKIHRCYRIRTVLSLLTLNEFRVHTFWTKANPFEEYFTSDAWFGQ